MAKAPTGPGDDNPTGPQFPTNPNACLTQACAGSLAAVVDAANDIVSTCGQISDANNRASILLGIAAGLFGIGATVIGGLVSAIGVAATVAILAGASIASAGLLPFLVFWFAVSLIATGIAILAAYVAVLAYVAWLQGQLSGKRDAFTQAAAKVRANCAPSCWGNLVMPSC